jgi:hypothetical protein
MTNAHRTSTRPHLAGQRAFASALDLQKATPPLDQSGRDPRPIARLKKETLVQAPHA